MIKRNAQVHVIYCHPSNESITHNILKGYIQGLSEKNIEHTITDLYASDFKTDITEKEYLRENYNIDYPLDDDVKEEQEKINKADILTFIFPLFWMDAPSKLVGYFSRVFTKGFKYENENNISNMNTLKCTNFLISAGSDYATLKDDGKIDSLKKVFIEDRMSEKTEKAKMYFFTQTTYEKEKKYNNKEKYFNLAKDIAKKNV